MKLIKIRFLLFVLFCCLTGTVSAQKVWEKPFQKWNKEQATKILTDSPWAQTYQSTNALGAVSQEQAGRAQIDGSIYRSSGAGAAPGRDAPTPVVIRLHSALLVRQALVRIRQIDAGYDKMDDAKRAEFDKSTVGFLSCAICQNYYVVTLTKYIDNSGLKIDEGLFQRTKLEQLKGNVWLSNEKGEKCELIQFNAPKSPADSAVFYFARLDDKGAPFLTLESKTFALVFNGSFLDARNPYTAFLPKRLDFNVSKLTSASNLLF